MTEQEKPPVLSDEEIVFIKLNCSKGIVDTYNPNIILSEDGQFITLSVGEYREHIAQARQRAAEEIFKKTDCHKFDGCFEAVDCGDDRTKFVEREWYKALKSRYLSTKE